MIELDLRDIHLPDGLPWWPLAPGWWLLTLLLILLCAGIWWYLRWRRQPLKQASLRELTRLRDAFSAGASRPQMLAEISALLRRVAISQYGRETAAGLTGEAWQTCLRELSQVDAFDAPQLELLVWHRYREGSDYDIDGLLRASENWIRSLPREGRHVSA